MATVLTADRPKQEENTAEGVGGRLGNQRGAMEMLSDSPLLSSAMSVPLKVIITARKTDDTCIIKGRVLKCTYTIIDITVPAKCGKQPLENICTCHLVIGN